MQNLGHNAFANYLRSLVFNRRWNDPRTDVDALKVIMTHFNQPNGMKESITFCCNDLTGRRNVSVKWRFLGNLGFEDGV